ncbi:MAG: hypothetical protein EBQ96_09610 [Proteobacteria bacterium]|nr:hypothetical protein [Pseudomonadota bacterium]
MTEAKTYPLFDLVMSHRPRLSIAEEDLRDEGKPLKEVEARRMAELKGVIEKWKGGLHPFLVLLEALEVALSAYKHPLYSAVDIAHRYQHHKNSRSDPDPTPEELETARRETTEKVAGHVIKNIYPYALQYPHSEETLRAIAHAEGMLTGKRELWSDLKSPSLALILHIARSIHKPDEYRFSSREYGLEGIEKELIALGEQERADRYVDPKDKHIPTDLLALALTLEPDESFAKRRTKDMYTTEDEVEVRRAVALEKALEAWYSGTSPLLVLNDLGRAVSRKYDELPIGGLAGRAQSVQADQKRYHGHDPQDSEHVSQNKRRMGNEQIKRFNAGQRSIMRLMKTRILAYTGPESDPELASEIRKLIDHLNTGTENSLSIVHAVAEAMFEPVDDKKYARVFFDREKPLLTQIRQKLAEQRAEEEAEREAKRPMPTLKTETEDEFTKPLRNIFKGRALGRKKRNYKAPPKLCSEIHIAAAGSGMIKPYHTGEDKHKEDLYGATIARITTYTVSFVPKSPEMLEQLERHVRVQMRKLAKIEYPFEIPFDFEAEPYKRPYIGDRYDRYRPKYGSMDSLHVYAKDGKVHIHTQLDLDDIWSLYYLLSDVIEPSAQIAHAMNTARYAEERGTLETRGGLDSPYDKTHMTIDRQLGSLSSVRPERYLETGLMHALGMYAMDQISDEQFLHQMTVLADHTLAGRLADPHGALPTYQELITDQTKGTEVAEYSRALKDRTVELLQILTGTEDRSMLYPALIARVAEISKPLRDRLRRIEERREEEFWSDRSYSGRSRGVDLKDVLAEHEKALKLSDAFAGRAKQDEEAAAERRKKALTVPSNIALRASDVGVTVDRTWRGTKYVSRSKGSLWVRKDMPANLKPFMREAQSRPTMAQMLLGFKG